MRVLHKNVLIEQIESEDLTTDSGLILSGTSEEGVFQKAKIISVGDKVESPMKPGDIALVLKGSAQAVKGDDRVEYLLVADKNIAAIL
jgi:co-chaperonin GroES (HSP10)